MPADLSDLDHEQRDRHREKFGGFNDLPPNMVEVQEADFWPQFMMYSPTMVEFRQVHRPEGEVKRLGLRHMNGVHLYHYTHGEGLAMAEVVKDARQSRPRFFRFFLCEHKRTETLPGGNCYHRWRCLDCGEEFSRDSSG